MPRLRVLAGPSPDKLSPVSTNTNKAHTIKSDIFEGKVIVHIKGFPDPSGNVLDSEYFEREDRQNVTWSIQVQGRFLQPHSADDILFGNTFDRPLKLPWGAGAALKFMNFIDPTLEHDLTSHTKPWALSPLISTMPHFIHTPVEEHCSPPQFPSTESIGDDTSHLNVDSPNGSPKGSPNGSPNGSPTPENSRSSPPPRTANKRRAYFSRPERRKAITFGPGDVITTDFCYGFITFPQLTLCLPGGISFDLTKYWDGQPVRFVCCERPQRGESMVDARMFWCVAIERVGDD